MAITYKRGFLKKIAEYKKSAKLLAEMSPDERRKAEIASKNIEKDILKEIPKRIVYGKPKSLLKPWEILEKKPETPLEEWSQLGRKASRRVGSIGRGILASLGVTGARTLEGIYDILKFTPSALDSLVFGYLGGINDGKGLLGEDLNKVNRFADKTVHKIRQWSENYDEKNGINSKLNRFLQGVGADTLGSFLGFGGLGGLGVKGFSRLIGPTFGILGARSSLADGQHRQLREREAILRLLDPRFKKFFDATSTIYNQENSPTLKEYQRYHIPIKNRSTSFSGRLQIPWSWRHKENSEPIQSREYGR